MRTQTYSDRTFHHSSCSKFLLAAQIARGNYRPFKNPMMSTLLKFESKEARLNTYKICTDDQAGADIVAITDASICTRASAETGITSTGGTIATVQKIKVAKETCYPSQIEIILKSAVHFKDTKWYRVYCVVLRKSGTALICLPQGAFILVQNFRRFGQQQAVQKIRTI